MSRKFKLIVIMLVSLAFLLPTVLFGQPATNELVNEATSECPPPSENDNSSAQGAFEADYFGMRYRGFARNLIDRDVKIHGAWEKHILYFLRDFCSTKKGADCVFVDIGANP